MEIQSNSSEHVVEALGNYCFGECPQDRKAQIEAHLLKCDDCWQQAIKLSGAVAALRSGKSADLLSTPDLLQLCASSIRSEEMLGGFALPMLLLSLFFGALFGLALIGEVSFSLDAFRPTIWWVAMLIFVEMSGVSWFVLYLTNRFVRSYSRNGLFGSAAILVGCSALLFLGICFYLPDTPITRGTIQMYPARAAYLKGICYYVPWYIFMLLVPYHFVLTAQRELSRGGSLTIQWLGNPKFGAGTDRSIFLPPWLLAVVWIAAMIASIFLASHLFNNLEQGPHTGLFITLMQTLRMLMFGFGAASAAWYAYAVSDLRRECMVRARLQSWPRQ